MYRIISLAQTGEPGVRAFFDERTRLTNHRELCQKLSIEVSSSIEIILIEAYRRFEDECVNDLAGDYAFLIEDRRQEAPRFFGARSPIGSTGFYLSFQPHCMIVSSELSTMLEQADINFTQDVNWLGYWLATGYSHWSRTPYTAIKPLPAGHSFSLSRSRGMEMKRFWLPSLIEKRSISSQEAVEEFRHLFLKIIGGATVGENKESECLFDLSGGLDSSSIVSTAAQLSPDKTLHCFHAETPNSNQYIDAMKQRYPQISVWGFEYKKHSYMEGSFEFFGVPQPSRPHVLLPDFYGQIYQHAQDLGVKTWLRGDFGDELFTTSVVGGEQPEEVSWLNAEMIDLVAQQIKNDNAMMRERCPDIPTRALYQWILRHDDYRMQAEIIWQQSSLKVIEPFADLRLIELQMSSPSLMRGDVNRRKAFLRQAMKQILPDEIRTRRGKGTAYTMFYNQVSIYAAALRLVIADVRESGIDNGLINFDEFSRVFERVALGDYAPMVALSSTLSLLLWQRNNVLLKERKQQHERKHQHDQPEH